MGGGPWIQHCACSSYISTYHVRHRALELGNQNFPFRSALRLEFVFTEALQALFHLCRFG